MLVKGVHELILLAKGIKQSNVWIGQEISSQNVARRFGWMMKGWSCGMLTNWYISNRLPSVWVAICIWYAVSVNIRLINKIKSHGTRKTCRSPAINSIVQVYISAYPNLVQVYLLPAERSRRGGPRKNQDMMQKSPYHKTRQNWYHIWMHAWNVVKYRA